MKSRHWLLLIGISLMTLSLGLANPLRSNASRNEEKQNGAPQINQPPDNRLQKEFKEGELLVKFKHGLSRNAARNINARVGSDLLKEFSYIDWHHVRLPRGMSVGEGMARYKKIAGVVSAEPNYPLTLAAIPDDPRYADQYGLQKIQAPAAWDTTTGSPDVVLAVLDTGVNYNHQDLAANMWHNPGEIAGNSIDDDNNGYVDDVYGIDPSNSDADPLDDAGHGTSCAGILGAVGNNATGVTGLNWSVKIMALKIFFNASISYTANAIEAFEYVTMMKNRGVNVRATSNSWRFVGGQSLKDAIDVAGEAGIANVFASGNNDHCEFVCTESGCQEICRGADLDVEPVYPTAWDSPSIIAVAASDQNDNLTHFSGYGHRSVDLAAPGLLIWTTGMTDGTYSAPSGTSMSTPFVAGAVGLLAAHDSSLSVASMKATLINTVDVLPPFINKTVSGGRLNVARALQQPTVCAYALSQTSQTFSANAGTGRINVTTPSNCEWAATTGSSFITIDAGVGNGSGAVEYSIAANNTGSQRSGTINISGQTYNVTQAAAVAQGCAQLSPASESFTSAGGSNSVNIIADENCEYAATASSNDFWITVTSVSNTVVSYSVEPNPGNARTGTLLIANRTFTVTQETGCTFSLSPTAQSFDAIGGFGSFNVTTPNPRCSWTPISNASWLHVYSVTTGAGNGTVSFYLDANSSGVDRTGTISVANQTFTVSQGHCLFSFSPTETFVSSNGASGSVSLTTPSDCAWTVFTDEDWIHITSATSGTGNATITYTVDKNLTAQYRGGKVYIGDQPFFITQDTHQPGKIAYSTDLDGDFEIYVMNNDGNNRTRLTDNNAYDDAAAWSPDGSRIAFQSNRDGHLNLYVMNHDGSNQTRLTTTNSSDVNPAWSPDGTKIAFQSFRDGTSQIYVMNADGTNQTRITNNFAFDSLPTWSPDGTKIAFATNRDNFMQIYVMNADGSNQTRLTNTAANDHMPAWSPDGKKIAFTSDRSGRFQIYVMNADGTHQTRLTNTAAGSDLYPQWSSPDGSQLVFTSSRDNNNEIYSMNADGGNQVNLSNHTANDYAPAWRPQ